MINIIWGIITERWELILLGVLSLGGVVKWLRDRKHVLSAAHDLIDAVLDAMNPESNGGEKITRKELDEIFAKGTSLWQVIKRIKNLGK